MFSRHRDRTLVSILTRSRAYSFLMAMVESPAASSLSTFSITMLAHCYPGRMTLPEAAISSVLLDGVRSQSTPTTPTLVETEWRPLAWSSFQIQRCRLPRWISATHRPESQPPERWICRLELRSHLAAMHLWPAALISQISWQQLWAVFSPLIRPTPFQE